MTREGTAALVTEQRELQVVDLLGARVDEAHVVTANHSGNADVLVLHLGFRGVNVGSVVLRVPRAAVDWEVRDI